MNENKVLSATSLALLFLTSFFWYCAEVENEILREEITMLEYNKSTTNEGK